MTQKYSDLEVSEFRMKKIEALKLVELNYKRQLKKIRLIKRRRKPKSIIAKKRFLVKMFREITLARTIYMEYGKILQQPIPKFKKGGIQMICEQGKPEIIDRVYLKKEVL